MPCHVALVAVWPCGRWDAFMNSLIVMKGHEDVQGTSLFSCTSLVSFVFHRNTETISSFEGLFISEYKTLDGCLNKTMQS